MEPALIVNQPHLFEAIHEETDAGAGGLDHLSECFLANLRNDLFRLAFFPEVGHEQQRSRQPLLAGVKELIHQVFLDANVPG